MCLNALINCLYSLRADGVDYTHIKEFVSLPTYDEKTRICYKIPILNNKDIEQSEEFTVLLKPGVSTPPNVRLQPGQVQVRIVDDEIGMHGYNYTLTN